jgi:hypothetical protein
MQITVIKIVRIGEGRAPLGSNEPPAQGLYELHAELDDGHLAAARDLIRDWRDRAAAQARGAGQERPGPDWRLIREAEASARETGLRASVPDQAAAGTSRYAADLAQWGDGRGVGPDGPQAADGPEAGG